jgi:hypothetical protein
VEEIRQRFRVRKSTLVKPMAILDPQWRRLNELFAADDLQALGQLCELVWARDGHMPETLLSETIGRATFTLPQIHLWGPNKSRPRTSCGQLSSFMAPFPTQ